MSWNLLHLLAWAFGLKAAFDLRREAGASDSTARLLSWSVAACLLMELAMLGSPLAAGFGLLSALTGILAAMLLGWAMLSLRDDLDERRPRFPVPGDPSVAALIVLLILGALGAGLLDAHATAAAARLAGSLEDTAWISVSAAGLALLTTRRFRSKRAEAFGPLGLAAAFGFSLLGAAASPFELVTGIVVGASARALIGTLFILTLVTTLYATLLRLRGRNLAAARERLAESQRQLHGVEKLAAIGTLAAGAAHDFNNALSVILGFVELELDDPALRESTRRHLVQVEHAAQNATATASGLLGLARRQSPAAYGTLREAVEAPVDLLETEWRRHRIAVRRQIEPIEVAATVDLALISQVCLNLFLNARDALVAKGGGELDVALRRAADEVEIRVADTGGGIPAAFRERLFQPLATTKGDRGTGLGLATSRTIVEAMGGSITCESVEGEGATFLVRLPAAPTGKGETARATPVARQEQDRGPGGPRRRWPQQDSRRRVDESKEKTMYALRSLALLAALTSASAIGADPAMAAERHWQRDILREEFAFTGKTPSDVPWSEVVQGCSHRDCIPSIDVPGFAAAGKGHFLRDDDLVLGIVRAGEVRAYPAYILDHHEIVNDVIAGEPIAITWCPLCGSGLAFVRTLDGEPIELGVSGLLRESDMVFYDRRTKSLWQQVTGTAFAGPSRGKRLTAVPVAVATWRRWREAHPDTMVLTTDNARPAKPAYGDYGSSERLLFPITRRSAVLHPKTVVWGIEVEGGAVAVTESWLVRDSKPVAVEVGGTELRISGMPDGSVRAARAAGAGDSRELVAHRMFWFAWYTFHPDTRLLTGKEKP